MDFIETLKIEELTNLDLVSGYYYWISTIDIQKSLNIKNDGYYLPCYPFETKINNPNKLIDTDLLLFMNKPKIIYGTLKIKSILTKEKKEKKELEYLKNNFKEDVDKEEELNDMVIIDTEKFENLINVFNVANIPELFFIKFEKILIFKFRIDLNKFCSFINDNHNESKYEFKYPKKINNKNIIKSYSNNSLNLHLQEYLNYLEKNNKNNKNDIVEKNIFEDLITSTEMTKINGVNEKIRSDSFVNFDIPILYNGCGVIKNSFVGNITLTKKMLLEHIEKCKDCEIINNSDKKIKFNKKIVIKIISNKNNYKIFDDIIFSYHNVKKITLKEDNDEFNFEKEKINIIFCPKYKNLYYNCIFLLNQV